MGVIALFYLKYFSTVKISGVMSILFWFFIITFFLIWSPIDIWWLLPKSCEILQFSFRLLTQLQWIGVLILAGVLQSLFFHKFDEKHVILGAFFIGIANGSWLISNHVSDQKIENIVTTPRFIDKGANAFVIKSDSLRISQSNIMPVDQTQRFCHQVGKLTQCVLTTKSEIKILQLPLLYYPSMLKITVNGQLVSYQGIAQLKQQKSTKINPSMVSIPVATGDQFITARFIGLPWANIVSLCTWLFLLGGLFYDCNAKSITNFFRGGRY
jgi:hypothetical protein